MNFSAVALILVSMLFVQASCQPVRSSATDQAVKKTIELIRMETRTVLGHLQDITKQLPEVSCKSTNVTELLGPDKQPSIAHSIPTFSCYLQRFSENITELSVSHADILQYLQDVEQKLSGEIRPKNCSLPAFEQDLDRYIHARCFLQLMEERLSSSKSW